MPDCDSVFRTPRNVPPNYFIPCVTHHSNQINPPPIKSTINSITKTAGAHPDFGLPHDGISKLIMTPHRNCFTWTFCSVTETFPDTIAGAPHTDARNA
jgi:hypothetical protein